MKLLDLESLKMFDFLKKHGILGMNARLGSYILPFNKRKDYPLVDNKIEASKLAALHGIQGPNTHFLIHSFGDIKEAISKFPPLTPFVIKPNRGAMGKGILIVEKINDDGSSETSKGRLEKRDLIRHLSHILNGMYSLGGLPDSVIIQEKLSIHKALAPYAYKGIPDIRVIVFKGYPVMSMMRLPTKMSQGRANLHQGAVGLGLGIGTGEVVSAIHKNIFIRNHPDTNEDLYTLKIPNWREVLELASKCYNFTNMGYLGVDIVLDEKKGPLLLEINARPGLSIQVANRTGLVPRLEKIKDLDEKLLFHQKVDLAIKMFT